MGSFDGLNRTTQGNIGLGMAIAHFTMKCWTVCVPLNDNQPYDLVVEFEGKLQRVQVKTTGFKRGGKRGGDNYCVALKATRHNRSGFKTNLFDSASCDYVFVLTEAGDKYLIPATEITAQHEIILYAKYDKFKV